MRSIFAMLAILAFTSAAAAENAATQPIAFTEVTVINVADGVAERGRTVVVTGDQIAAVGETGEVEIPSGATVIDARGKYLIPGLWDVHVHLFNNVSRRPPDTWAFPLFVANGVTAVREMWTEVASMPVVRQWQTDISHAELLAPRVVAAGALVDGARSWVPNMPEVTTRAAGRRFVTEAARAGVDFIKVYSLLSPEVYEAIVEEAAETGIPVDGHIPKRVAARDALRAGQRTNEHLHQIPEACSTIEAELLEERRRFYSRPYTSAEETALLDDQVRRTAEGFDEQICRKVARAIAEAGQWQVPTLSNERRWFFGVPAERAGDARLTYIPPRERAAWRRTLERGGATYEGDPMSLRRGWNAKLRIVDVLGEAGAGILAGTDFGNIFVLPGFSLHDELALLVEAGLSPLQALQAATLNPARALNATESMGSVEAGKLADLVLLEASPLEDIANTRRIAGVVLNGRYLDREALDALLAEAERAANASVQ